VKIALDFGEDDKPSIPDVMTTHPDLFFDESEVNRQSQNLMMKTPVPAGFLRSGYADFSFHERQTRNSEKIKQLLNFLKEETYSDFKTLMLLFGFRDHKSLYSLLAKTERMGLIQKHVLESRTMKISLWGITSDGLAVVLTPNDKIFPARLNHQNHRLDAGAPS
jgi:hypothetical protein